MVSKHCLKKDVSVEMKDVWPFTKSYVWESDYSNLKVKCGERPFLLEREREPGPSFSEKARLMLAVAPSPL